jgi:uracil-DNA glycosylase family protein
MRKPYPGAEAFLPPRPTLAALRTAVQQCRGCPLYRNATQAIPGEGAARATLLLVGEQPGNDEDRAGHPFVGPAGKLLDQALDAAAIDRKTTFLTNAVKHFKWEPSGARRLHQKPDAAEVHACIPWLHTEVALVRPQVIVCLGATAAQALLGAQIRVTRDRGRDIATPLAAHAVATMHPSAILRQRTHEDRAREFAGLVADLRFAATLLSRAR